MPKVDFALIDALKKRALAAGQEIKKSQVLRAGLHLLAALPVKDLLAAMQATPALKTGRPKK
jgi:hypothetical protein